MRTANVDSIIMNRLQNFKTKILPIYRTTRSVKWRYEFGKHQAASIYKPLQIRRPGTSESLDGVEDLVMPRKSSGFLFGKNLLAIDDNLENSPV
jgi:hypothetical protein